MFGRASNLRGSEDLGGLKLSKVWINKTDKIMKEIDKIKFF